jgi:integrase
MARKKEILFQVLHSKFIKNGCEWVITGYPEGKRVRLWFRTEKLAIKAANERNEEITATGTQDQLPYALRITALQGSKELEAHGKTLADAVTHYLDQLKEEKSAITVAELVKRYMAETDRRVVENEITERHAETVKWATSKLVARFGETLLPSLTGAEIKAWVAAMDLATKTKNRILNYNSQMFSIAGEWELLAANPLTDISRFRYRVGNHGEDEIQILTVEELTSLLDRVDTRLVPYIAIGAFTGLRDAEMKKLKWSEIDLDKRQIEVKKWKSKTAQRRFVTISDNLLSWLQPHVQASGPVIPLSNSPGHVGNPSSKLVYQLRKKARIEAGMTEWKRNCLRHSFCSYHYAMYEDAGKTAAQAGHTSPATTFANYRELIKGGKPEAEKYWAIRPAQAEGCNRRR